MTSKTKPQRILFLCVANSARSQMAEGLARTILGPDFIIASAGSQPSGSVQPWAIRVLKEEGIDISAQRSKAIHDLPKEFLEQLDFVVTLCAEEICPVLNSQAERLQWPIPDPASAPESEKPKAFKDAFLLIQQHLFEFSQNHLS